jgi:uncharacterized protein (DUF1697 family)
MSDIPGNGGCTYVAFLRGINVGGRSKIRMDDLRRAFESLGFLSVKTVLTSGNVLFEAPKESADVLAMDISRKMGEMFGRDLFVIVRTLDDIRELIDSQPFKGIHSPGARLFVTFFRVNEGKGSIPKEEEGYRIMSIADGVACSVLYERPGIGAGNLMIAIENEMGKNVTTRSWNTITRLIRSA